MNGPESFDDTHAITLIGAGPSAVSRVLKPGEVVGGQYQIKSLLGQGGMGYVFCAEHTMMHRDYALKILAPEQLNDEGRQRFETEGRAIANLDHANIVKVYNMGLDHGDCPFYVMDLLDGVALSDYISAKNGLDLEECLEIFRQIASGLGYAHSKGIVHRDVKPSNIVLLTDSKGQKRVKIVDFGIAKLLPAANMHRQSQTATGKVFGSPLYMSPEQSLGRAVDHRSDVYSLGCTFFEALVGRPPYRGANAMQTMIMHQDQPIPSILEERPGKRWPQSVDLLLRKMMAKKQESRYQSMDQFVHDLDRVKEGKAIGGAVVLETPDVAGRGLDAEEDEEHEANPLSFVKLLPVIGAAMVVLALIGGGGYVLHEYMESHVNHKPLEAARQAVPALPADMPAKPSTTQRALTPSKDEWDNDSHVREVQKAFDQIRRIKSTKRVVDGTTRRHFEFPTFPIGIITYPGDTPVKASGPRDLPVGVPLKLEIGKDDSVEIFNYPDIIDRIDVGEFDELLLDGKDLSFREGLREKTTVNPGLASILRAAAKWPKLRSLTLEKMTASEDALKQLDGFLCLKQLDIRRVEFDANKAAQQSFLKRLEVVQFTNIHGLGPVLRALGTSTTLNQARLIECDTTPEDLAPLLGCRSMSILAIKGPNLDKLLPCIIEHNWPPNIVFLEQYLSLAQINAINLATHINCVWVNPEKYSEAEISSYKATQRKVNFLPYAQPRKKEDPL